MPSAKLIIKKNSVRKDGLTPIYLQYSYSRNKRTLFNTQKLVKPQHWNADKCEVRKSHPEANKINVYIHLLLRRLEELIENAIINNVDPTISHLKMKFNNGVLFRGNNEGDTTLFHYLDQFQASQKHRVQLGVLMDYRSLKLHLAEFEKVKGYKVEFSSINYDFYLKFTDFLKTEYQASRNRIGLAPNTIGKDIKNLKSFYRYCVRIGVAPPKDLSAFKSETEQVDNIYLNEAEIAKIITLQLPIGSLLDQCRDLFVIGCETGLRYSDYSRITPSHIKDKFLEINMQKTSSKVVVPISNNLRQILNKYDNNPPKHIPLVMFNEQLKLIGSQAGINEEIITVKKRRNQNIEERQLKYQLITSHTARRSFCTNQFNKGMPSLLIRKISGHRSEKSFLRYIKIDEQQAAEKMLAYWNK